MPLLSATFTFDDHIRCMAAKQRLTKGRIKARQRKMHQIAKLLELPGSVGPSCPSPPTNNLSSMRDSRKLHSDLECVQSRFLVQKFNSNKIQKSVVCLHFLLFCLHFNFLFDLCQLFVDKAICTVLKLLFWSKNTLKMILLFLKMVKINISKMYEATIEDCQRKFSSHRINGLVQLICQFL